MLSAICNDMAKAASFEGALRVSRSYRETGRKRHRIPSSVQIPYETSLNINIPQPGHHAQIDPPNNDDNNNDDNDDGDDGDDGDDHDTTVSNESELGGDIPMEDAMFLFDEPPEVNVGPLLPVGVVGGFFDDGMLDVELPSSDDDSDEEVDEDDSQIFANDTPEGDGLPRVAPWRMNLTALSQAYNIYMVAYSDKIYVSRPRSCVTNFLPHEPDLILQPAASDMGVEAGGYLDENFPHQVNHLIVSDFGNEEILVLAYDDGDVIAYYTRHIENELLRRERGGRINKSVPGPFFHENVDKSAWGLAVHKQSRMIAVSSNYHDVTVFVFALTGLPYYHIPGVDDLELFRAIIRDEHGRFVDRRERSSQLAAGITRHFLDDGRIAALETAVRRRDANWRIIIETGDRVGANIPNIAFSSDVNGEAENIVAVDISGRLWFLDFWAFNQRHYLKADGLHPGQPRLRHHGLAIHSHKPRGWGVLVLPESSFLPVRNKDDAIGMSLEDAKYVSSEKLGSWIDISQGIKNVENNSRVHPWVRWGHHTQFAFNPLEPRRAQIEQSWFDFASPMSSASRKDRARDMMSRRERESHPDYQNPPRSKAILGDGSSIMRTYEMDIELRSFDDVSRGIMFEKVIDQMRPSQAVLPSMRMAHERLANLIHVPELSLVVAASLCGRVALVTLTRPMEKGLSFKRAFRVDAILPTAEEEDKQKRPICPLLGVAVGPVPFSGSPELAERPINPRPYRIMLHFYDLSILSYNISRCPATDSLSIS
ncbi:hypothetical protein F5B19DRAFT_442606 [Rostrohypoxylon terebratum]|nr:hypothetical protein F5B19DRAFT_442606 [Rostrohypoxylon terebratum]